MNCSEIGQIPRRKGYSNIIKYRIPAHCRIFNLEIEMPAHAFEGLHLEAGSTIKVSLKKSAIHIIKEC